jgi:hypothetical protein
MPADLTRDVSWDQTPPSAYPPQEGNPPTAQADDTRRQLDELSKRAEALHDERYPRKSANERAIGPSDLDALRTALREDIRGLMSAQSAANATGTLQNGGGVSMTSPGIPGIAVGLHPGYYASTVSGASASTAPLDCMAVVLCDQIRTALHYLDDLEHGPTPQGVCPDEAPPMGTRARLEQAGALMDRLNSRLSAIVNQGGAI